MISRRNLSETAAAGCCMIRSMRIGGLSLGGPRNQAIRRRTHPLSHELPIRHMKLTPKHTIVVLGLMVYFFAYLSLRWFCLCQTAYGPSFPSNVHEKMTGTEVQEALVNWKTSRPIDYGGPPVAGVLRVLFFPLATLDQVITGRKTEGRWRSHRAYRLPFGTPAEGGYL